MEAELLDGDQPGLHSEVPSQKWGGGTVMGQGVEELDPEPILCDLSFKLFLL